VRLSPSNGLWKKKGCGMRRAFFRGFFRMRLFVFFEEDNMSRKLFFFGAIALLGTVLFSIGCPTDSDGEPGNEEIIEPEPDNDDEPGYVGINPPVEVEAQRLASQLGGAQIDDMKVTLNHYAVIEQDVIVPSFITLVVPSNCFLSVPVGKSLTVAQAASLIVENKDNLVIDGNGGALIITKYAASVEWDGIILAPDPGQKGIWNTQNRNLSKELVDTLGVGASIRDDGMVEMIGTYDFTGTASVVPAGVKLFVSGGGTINVGVSGTTGTLSVEGGVLIKVESSGKLNVVNGTLNVNDGGKIEVASGGTLTAATSGTLNVKGGGSVNMTDSTLTVAKELNVEERGKINVSSGKLEVNGSGAKLNVKNKGTLEVTGTGDLEVTEGTLALDGALKVAYGAKLNVASAGTGNSTLEVNSGGALEVANGSTFTVASTGTGTSTLDVKNGGMVKVSSGGTLEVNDKLDVATGASFEVSGTLNIGANATSTSNAFAGRIIIKDGGKAVVSGTGANLTGNGLIVVEYGGQAEQDGKKIAGKGSSGAAFELMETRPSGSTFSFNATTYKLTGNATLNGLGSTKEFLLSNNNNNQTLEVNGTLTVAAGVKLSGNGTPPTVSKITIGANGSVAFTSVSASNFYPSGGGSAELPQSNKTYTWNDNLNNNVGGWERAP
jgi:hypothetical protein